MYCSVEELGFCVCWQTLLDLATTFIVEKKSISGVQIPFFYPIMKHRENLQLSALVGTLQCVPQYSKQQNRFSFSSKDSAPNCHYTIPNHFHVNFQGQAGWGIEEPGLVGDVPAQGRVVGVR